MEREIRKTIAMRPTPELEETVYQAEKATGATANELLKRCVAKSIAEVVSELMVERQRALQGFQNYMLKETPPKPRTKPGR